MMIVKPSQDSRSRSYRLAYAPTARSETIGFHQEERMGFPLGRSFHQGLERTDLGLGQRLASLS